MASASQLPELPAVRALDMERAEQDGVPGLVLVDRLGLSEPTFLPNDLLAIVGRCDGTRTIERIRVEASLQLGEDLPAATVRGIVQQLDARLLLLGERFDRAARAAAEVFLAGGVRPAVHSRSAGLSADPEQLGAILTRLVPENPPASALRGLVAPHIDIARGHAGYAAAYGRLCAAPPADLYVVFGTGHAGPRAPVTGLPLDWQTPLGRVATDRAFVAAVHAAIGPADSLDLLHHQGEHSLEFQMLFLQYLHQRRGGDRPFAVAGFLCGALPSADGDPFAEPWCEDLLLAFRAAELRSGKAVCYLAGADLAHVGPVFGDEQPVDAVRLAALEASERTRLAQLERGRPGAFHAAVVDCDNPDRVCSAPAIALTAALAGGPGALLHYGQARADDGSQAVSFCAMSFGGAAFGGAAGGA